MTFVAHAADLIALALPAVGLLVWLLLTTLRERRQAKETQGGESPDHEPPPADS